MCYTTAQEAGLKGQTMQDPWLPHVVFTKPLSQSDLVHMGHNHSQDPLEENDQASCMIVIYVCSSKIWHEIVHSPREI